MTDEFPAELIERCRQEVMRGQPTSHNMICAVLRASGHAELVKALNGYRTAWNAQRAYIELLYATIGELAESSHQLAVKNVVKADAALKAAGEK